MILGLDPGTTQSALVAYDPATHAVCEHVTCPNEDILRALQGYHRVAEDVLVIEQIAAMGMAVGNEVFETCWWSGRFYQAWRGHAMRLTRLHIKNHLCGHARAKDANVRQALIDRFGGVTCTKKGGALYRLKGHEWSGLACAIVYAEMPADDARSY